MLFFKLVKNEDKPNVQRVSLPLMGGAALR
jgi:hypothetical protein